MSRQPRYSPAAPTRDRGDVAGVAGCGQIAREAWNQSFVARFGSCDRHQVVADDVERVPGILRHGQQVLCPADFGGQLGQEVSAIPWDHDGLVGRSAHRWAAPAGAMYLAWGSGLGSNSSAGVQPTRVGRLAFTQRRVASRVTR